MRLPREWKWIITRPGDFLRLEVSKLRMQQRWMRREARGEEPREIVLQSRWRKGLRRRERPSSDQRCRGVPPRKGGIRVNHWICHVAIISEPDKELFWWGEGWVGGAWLGISSVEGGRDWSGYSENGSHGSLTTKGRRKTEGIWKTTRGSGGLCLIWELVFVCHGMSRWSV